MTTPKAPFRHHLSGQRETACGGFTLIETALALLAIGLGLLGIFGLSRIGLETTKETENEQRCIQMADAVFETLREYNARLVDEARTNTVSGGSWLQRWQKIRTNEQKIPFPPVANMSTSSNLTLRFFTEFAPAYDKTDIRLSEWNPRYELAITQTWNTSDVNDDYDGKVLMVTLAIYPDGDTYSSERRIFYTTLMNPGGLP